MKQNDELELLVLAGYSVTQNKGLTRDGKMVHKDIQDYGINYAVPWGEFTGGLVVLI